MTKWFKLYKQKKQTNILLLYNKNLQGRPKWVKSSIWGIIPCGDAAACDYEMLALSASALWLTKKKYGILSLVPTYHLSWVQQAAQQ